MKFMSLCKLCRDDSNDRLGSPGMCINQNKHDASSRDKEDRPTLIKQKKIIFVSSVYNHLFMSFNL